MCLPEKKSNERHTQTIAKSLSCSCLCTFLRNYKHYIYYRKMELSKIAKLPSLLCIDLALELL